MSNQRNHNAILVMNIKAAISTGNLINDIIIFTQLSTDYCIKGALELWLVIEPKPSSIHYIPPVTHLAFLFRTIHTPPLSPLALEGYSSPRGILFNNYFGKRTLNSKYNSL